MVKPKKNQLLKTLKSFPKMLLLLRKHDRKYIYIMIAEAVAFSIEKYPALFIMKYTLDVLAQSIEYEIYLRNIIPMLAVMLCIKIFLVYANTTRPIRDQVVTENLFNSLFSKCMTVNYEDLESNSFQEKKDLAKQIASGKIAAIGWYFVEMLSSFIACIIATVLLIQVSHLLFTILALGLAIKAVLTKRIRNQREPLIQQSATEKRFLNYLFSIGTDFKYAKEFRVFRYKKNLFSKIDSESDILVSINRRIHNLVFEESFFSNANNLMSKAVIFIILGYNYLKSNCSIGDVTYTINLLNDYLSYSDALISSYSKYADTVLYIDNYFAFLEATSISCKVNGKPCCITNTNSHVLKLENVSYRYPGSDSNALENINLTICTPCKISLVGETGAGKSTLIKLLLRLYRPTTGTITLDGVDIHEYSLSDYYSCVSAIFQDYTLFAFSVKENILTDNEFNEATFKHIINDTGVEQFLRKNNQTVDSHISNEFNEDGVSFSGGEQQKIALARAAYKKQAFLCVLDEPTAFYDTSAELGFYKNYIHLFDNQLTFFISHRLASCRLSDRIIFLNKGSIVEDGPHNMLIQHNGCYKEMYCLQFQRIQERLTIECQEEN